MRPSPGATITGGSTPCSHGWIHPPLGAAAATIIVGLALGLVLWLAPAWLDPPRPLRIAINPWPGYEFATVADRLGFFQAEGVEVRLVELSSLSDCRRAFERGQVDAIFATPLELLHARRSTGRTASIVLVTDTSDGADVVLARSPARTVSDLCALRIGLEPASVNIVLLHRALERAGLRWSDIRPVDLAAPDMPGALARAEVDAVVTYPPASLEIIRAGLASPVFSSREIPGEIIDVLAFDDALIRGRPRDIDAVVRAFHRAQDYAAASPDAAHEIMAARERLDPVAFRAALTDGVRIATRADQHRYLAPGGLLQRVLDSTEAVLEHTAGLAWSERAGPTAWGGTP